MIDYVGDRDLALGLARAYAPYKTGNLRYNAIQSDLTADGFTITYSLSQALYAYFLEEGTQKSKRHIGFISNRTVPAIASMLNSKYNGDKDMLSYYKGKSQSGYYDIPTIEGNEALLFQRGKVLEQSLNVDIKSVADAKNWQHKQGMETYFSDFAKIKF